MFYFLVLSLIGIYSFIGYISLPMSIGFLVIYLVYVLLIGLTECRRSKAESV